MFYTLTDMSWSVAILLILMLLVIETLQKQNESNGSTKDGYSPEIGAFIGYILIILPLLLIVGGILIVFIVIGSAMMTLSSGQRIHTTDLFTGIVGFLFLLIFVFMLLRIVSWIRKKLGLKELNYISQRKLSDREIIKQYLLVFIILGVIAGVVYLLKPRFTTPQVQTRAQAIQLLQTRAKETNLKDYWATTNCIDFQSGDQRDLYFSINIYEKHGGVCPGDPMTAPRAASFEIFKKDGSILWYDVTRNQYIPFNDYVKEFSGLNNGQSTF